MAASGATWRAMAMDHSKRITRAAEEVEADAMLLGLDDRARLAEKLILSLDAPPDEENLRLWVGEAARRLSELREGTSGMVAVEEMLRRMRASIP